MKSKRLVLISFVSFIFLIGTFLFVLSCNKSNNSDKAKSVSNDTSPVKITTITDLAIKNKIMQWQYKTYGTLISFKTNNNSRVSINDIGTDVDSIKF